MKTDKMIIEDLKEMPENGPNGPDNGQAKQSDATQSKDLTLLRGHKKRDYIIEEKLDGRRTKDVAADLGVRADDVSRIWRKNIGKLMDNSRYIETLVDNHISDLNNMTQESVDAFMDASKERKLDMLPHFLKSKDSVISTLMRGNAPQNQTNVQLNADKVEGFVIHGPDGKEMFSVGEKSSKSANKGGSETSSQDSDTDPVGPFELDGDSRD